MISLRPTRPVPAILASLLLLLALTARADDADEAQAISDLSSADYDKRIDAARTLGNATASKAAMAALARHLDDPDWGVQIAVSDALAKIGDPEPTALLAEKAVAGDVAPVREAALRAVLALDKNVALASLTKAAKSGKSPAEKLRAVRALAAFQDERLAGDLSSLAQDRDPYVRFEALRALGAVAGPERGEVFAKALQARGFVNQYGAALGLAAWISKDSQGRKRALPLLTGWLAANRPDYALRRARELFGSLDARLLSESFKADGGKSGAAGKAFLARLAAELGLADYGDEVLLLLRDRDENVRAAAVAALGNLGGAKDALDRVREALKDPSVLVQTAAYGSLRRLPGGKLDPATLASYPPDVRLMAASEIGRGTTGTDAELAALSGLLADTDWRVAAASAAALGRIFRAKAVEPLARLGGHADWKVRAAAAAGLGYVLSRQAIPPLIALVADKHAIVQGAGYKALQYVTRQDFGTDAQAWGGWWSANESKFTPYNPAETIRSLASGGYATDETVAKLFENMEIVVVRGNWDHVEQVLDDLKLRHVVVAPGELAKANLNPRQVVLVNCGAPVDEKIAEMLRWFVLTGGYLMSTDWAIQDTIQRTFPGMAKAYNKGATADDVVAIEPSSRDPLLAGVFAPHAQVKVWLEIQSFGIEIENPYATQVLVDSMELKQKYGLDTIYFSIEHGLGKAFHSMSHFFLQKEHLQSVRSEQELKVFAVDHLGLSVDQVRRMAAAGEFGPSAKEPLSRHCPVFRTIINFVDERLRREIGNNQ
ncbi:MAG: HEAT repeat domain-containing protein [Planctomycetes bacterium]|nr:HEAT repeat domain-containing protein [Planctomycetota bacterium]